jgi:GH25 family lysozyme M1 (1,4-beta-N-acetylmuramidase)
MTIFYPDISHFQNGLSLNGAVFVCAKATEGTTLQDPSYFNFKSQCAELGIAFFGYHYLRTSPISGQVANALNVLGTVPAMLDAESNSGNLTNILNFIDAYRNAGGVMNVIYLPHWYWQQIGSPNLKPLIDRRMKLVSSNYTTYSDDGPGWDPYGGMYPSIWQYTNRHPFNGQLVDFNAFKGTVDELWALVSGDPGGNTVSSDEVIIGMSQLFDQAANRSTATGRNFANDFYTVVSAALSDEFKSLNDKLDANQTALLAALQANVDAINALKTDMDAGFASVLAAIQALALPPSSTVVDVTGTLALTRHQEG